jgi:hypothetical protein
MQTWFREALDCFKYIELPTNAWSATTLDCCSSSETFLQHSPVNIIRLNLSRHRRQNHSGKAADENLRSGHFLLRFFLFLLASGPGGPGSLTWPDTSERMAEAPINPFRGRQNVSLTIELL